MTTKSKSNQRRISSIQKQNKSARVIASKKKSTKKTAARKRAASKK